MNNLNSGRGNKGWLRLAPAEAFRRGWESARKGDAFDAAYHDGLSTFEAANYENGRLLVLEGRRLGLTEIPPYRRLSARRELRRYVDGEAALAVRMIPSILDYLARVHARGRLEGMNLLPRRTTHQDDDPTLSFSVTLPGRARRVAR